MLHIFYHQLLNLLLRVLFVWFVLKAKPDFIQLWLYCSWQDGRTVTQITVEKYVIFDFDLKYLTKCGLWAWNVRFIIDWDVYSVGSERIKSQLSQKTWRKLHLNQHGVCILGDPVYREEYNYIHIVIAMINKLVLRDWCSADRPIYVYNHIIQAVMKLKLSVYPSTSPISHRSSDLWMGHLPGKTRLCPVL